MTRILIYITLFHLSITYCSAQNNITKNIYQRLDTMSLYYPPITFDTANDGSNRYYINGIRVDKVSSNISQINGQLMQRCKPCVLKVYDSTVLKTFGVQSGDGRTGFWIEYFPSGKIKTKGQYKETPTGNCTETICSIQHGEWQYYNQKGQLVKREIYSNGKLISKKLF